MRGSRANTGTKPSAPALLQTKALDDLPLDLQRRIIRLQRNPHLAARAKESALRDADAEAAAEFVPPNPELFWSAAAPNTPPPLDPRAPAAVAGAGAAPARDAAEDASLILAAQPGLTHSNRPLVKDRRMDKIRQLDRQAVKVRVLRVLCCLFASCACRMLTCCPAMRFGRPFASHREYVDCVFRQVEIFTLVWMLLRPLY